MLFCERVADLRSFVTATVIDDDDFKIVEIVRELFKRIFNDPFDIFLFTVCRNYYAQTCVRVLWCHVPAVYHYPLSFRKTNHGSHRYTSIIGDHHQGRCAPTRSLPRPATTLFATSFGSLT